MSDSPYIEPIYYHDGVTGWHHHHIEAGAIVHLSEASGHTTDADGTTVIFSQHLADHDEAAAGYDEPCVDDCEFAGLVPAEEPQ